MVSGVASTVVSDQGRACRIDRRFQRGGGGPLNRSDGALAAKFGQVTERPLTAVNSVPLSA